MNNLARIPLTILEEFLLLALNDDAGDFYTLARSTLDCATAGSVLMDLSLRRRIDNDLKNIFVVSAIPTEDDILDPALQMMAMAPVLTPYPIGHWLQQTMVEGEALREKALRRLEARGILKREEKKILWVFGTRRYPIMHDKEIREVKLRIFGVILRDDIPEPHDMMLTALTHACGLFPHLLTAHELAQATPRIEQVARIDLIGQAVAKSVMEIEAAIAMASGFR